MNNIIVEQSTQLDNIIILKNNHDLCVEFILDDIDRVNLLCAMIETGKKTYINIDCNNELSICDGNNIKMLQFKHFNDKAYVEIKIPLLKIKKDLLCILEKIATSLQHKYSSDEDDSDEDDSE